MTCIGGFPCRLLVVACCILIPCGAYAGAAADNDRWVPGYSSPGFGGNTGNIVGAWNSNGFVMALGVTGCQDVPGPNGTFETALLWIWDGDSYEYTGSGCVPNGQLVNAVAQRGPNIYIGGTFTNVDSLPIQYLARWDGQEWSAPWVDQLNGWVYSLAHDGTQNMYVGGSFSLAGTTDLSNVGRLDGLVWEPLADTGGLVQGTNGLVSQIEVGAGDIIVAGQFSTAGGETGVGNVASWSTAGSWSRLSNGVDTGGPGLLSLSFGSGSVWVTGAFDDASIPAKGIAYFELAGTDWQSPGDPALMSNLGIFEVDQTGGGRVFARGDFTNFGDPNTQRVAEWIPVPGTWAALPSIEEAYDPTLFNQGKRILAQQNDVFYFDQRDDSTESDLPVYHGGITHFDGTNWHGLGQGFGDWDLDGQGHHVTAIHEFGGEVFVGGSFPSAGDALHEGLARWQGGDWVAAGETLTSTGEVVVRDFATYQSDLVMGGCFVASGATTLNNISRWNGSDWVALGNGIPTSFCTSEIPDVGLFEGVQTLLPMGSDLYVGGNFGGGGAPGDNLVMWNGAAWSEVGGGTLGTVNDLVELGGDLYVAGTLTRVNDPVLVVKRIAKWDGVIWDDLGGGMDGGTPQYEGVYALASIGSDIYAAGDFTTAGGVAVDNIARWDGVNWHPLGAGVNGLVLDLEVVGNDLYATGTFTEAGGQVARGVAKWDGSTWTALGYGLNYVTVLGNDVGTGEELFFSPSVTQRGEGPEGDPTGVLYVGGQLSYTGDKLSNNFGIYQLGEMVGPEIFADGFESGDTSAWSNSVP